MGDDQPGGVADEPGPGQPAQEKADIFPAVGRVHQNNVVSLVQETDGALHRQAVDSGAVCQAALLQVVQQNIAASPFLFHEVGVSGASGQRLDAQRPRAGEQIQNLVPVFGEVGQHRENGAPDQFGSRAGRPPLRYLKRPAFALPGDNPEISHGVILKQAAGAVNRQPRNRTAAIGG